MKKSILHVLLIIDTLLMVLLAILVLTPKVYAYDTYKDTQNIIASDSPYQINYTYNYGPYSDTFYVEIVGSFANVNYITFYNLDSLLMYNPDWSLGAGWRAGVDTEVFYNQGFNDWYDTMILYVGDENITNSIKLYLLPDLSSGQTYNDFKEAFKQNVSIFINDTLDITMLYERAYNDGYQEGYYESDLLQDEIDTIESNAYNVGYTDGLNEANQSNFEWLTSVFYMIGYVLSIELIPSVTIGGIIMIPIAIKMIPFILGLFKGGSRE